MKKKKARKIKVYEMPDLNLAKGTKVVLGCDPGTANFGIALVSLKDTRPVVLANSMLMRPMNNLMEFNEGRKLFMTEVDRWIEQGANAIIAERFQTRGLLGPLVETVSVMIGSLGEYGLPIKAVIASQWKTAFKRRFGVDLKELYETVNVQPHQLDAALIGIYGLEIAIKQQLNWKPEQIFRQVERTSLIGLRRTK